MSTPTESPPRQAPEAKPDEADRFRFGWRYVWQKGEDGLMRQVMVPLSYEDVLHPQEEDVIVNNAAHDDDCDYLKAAFRRAVAGRGDSEVLHDVRVDWGAEGVRPHVPDIVVFLDVRKPWKRDIGTFPVKRLGARPLVVVEVTSPSTRSLDLDDKVVEYFKAGVPCYAIVDYRPELDEREVHVIGYRATPEGYLRINPNDRGWVWLEPVRLWLGSGGDRAVCFTENGDKIEEPEESERRAVEQAEEARRESRLARQQADDTRRERDEARAKLADMEAKLRRLESQPSDGAPG